MSRKSLIENFEAMIDEELAYRKAKMRSVFVDPPRSPVPDLDGEEWNHSYLLTQEREALGFYVSGHPLKGMGGLIARGSTSTASQVLLGEVEDGSYVIIGGVITFVNKRSTRKGDAMATVSLEDLTGSVECVFFPGAYKNVSAGISHDSIVFIGGRVDHGDGSPQVVGTSLTVPDLSDFSEDMEV